MESPNPDKIAADIQSAPPEVKARTLDSVVCHLLKVTLTESRHRERIRARIALKNIAKWVTINSTGVNL